MESERSNSMGSVLDRTSSYTGPEDIQDFDVSKYISSKPKITLEHITPTLASWIILLTYVVFLCALFLTCERRTTQ